MRPLGIDLETCSAADLKRTGAWTYSLHPSTDVHCLAYGHDPQDVRIWTPGEKVPDLIRATFKKGGQFLAHNAAFEDAIFRHVLGPKYGFPVPERRSWEDTMALALAMNLPAALEPLALALGTDAQKDTVGGKLMQKMAKSVRRKDGTWSIDPQYDTDANHLALQEYCRMDVITMLRCYEGLVPLSVEESYVYAADQATNERGAWIDFEFARSMQRMAQVRAEQLNKIARDESKGRLKNATGVPRMKKWLSAMGVKLPRKRAMHKIPGTKQKRSTVVERLDKDVVERLLHDPIDGVLALWGKEAGARVHRVLTARVEANRATSLSKLDRLEHMVDPRDGRIRNVFRYCGAITGRWSSQELQAHNLPKDKQDDALSAAVHRTVEDGDLESLIVLAREPMGALSQILRSIIAAPTGRELIAGDLNAIEARVLAWLAGESSTLNRFASGEDIYLATAAEVGHPGDRQLGKLLELGLGYSMGAVTFASRSKLDLKTSARLVRAWRKLRPRIVSYWADVQDGVQRAVREQGKLVVLRGRVVAQSDGSCLRVRLPSGRRIHYWRPQILYSERKIRTVNKDGEVEVTTIAGPELRYFRPGGAGMEQDGTYGGKLVENITQAIARDVIAEAFVRVERERGYDVVAHMHDAIAAEVDVGTGSEDWFRRNLEDVPTWAKGLPLKADVYRARRFRG